MQPHDEAEYKQSCHDLDISRIEAQVNKQMIRDQFEKVAKLYPAQSLVVGDKSESQKARAKIPESEFVIWMADLVDVSKSLVASLDRTVVAAEAVVELYRRLMKVPKRRK